MAQLAEPTVSSEGLIDKIDYGLAKYYEDLQQVGYRNEEGVGKFKLSCEENGKCSVISRLGDVVSHIQASKMKRLVMSWPTAPMRRTASHWTLT